MLYCSYASPTTAHRRAGISRNPIINSWESWLRLVTWPVASWAREGVEGKLAGRPVIDDLRLGPWTWTWTRASDSSIRFLASCKLLKLSNSTTTFFAWRAFHCDLTDEPANKRENLDFCMICCLPFSNTTTRTHIAHKRHSSPAPPARLQCQPVLV